MRGGSRLKQRGFTLIEVVVAFAIFALSIGALCEVYGSSARRAAHSALSARALMMAESLMAEQRLLPPPWASSRAGGADGLTWQVATAPYTGQPPNDTGWRAYEVSIDVRAADSTAVGATLRSIELARDSR